MDNNIEELSLSLFMGDNNLILSHRLSEWTGHAPVLEEELALANIALDLLGQARMWLEYAAEISEDYKTADDLAYKREIWEFRNVALVEQPNGHFGDTIVRQFYYDNWHKLVLEQLYQSENERIAGIAEKSLKEVRYHLERSAQWIVLLGDGTEESHNKLQTSVNHFWPYALELCNTNTANSGFDDDLASLSRQTWIDSLSNIIAEATLQLPETEFSYSGGREGIHTEHLSFILAEMQCLPRAYPGTQW